MKIVIGYLSTPEGTAAFEHARELARGGGHSLVVVNTGHRGNNNHPHFATQHDIDAIEAELTRAGIDHEVRQSTTSRSAAELIVTVADESDAGLIVIGLRPRSPVGKVLTGSTAQAVLIDAGCPVLAVKPHQDFVL